MAKRPAERNSEIEGSGPTYSAPALERSIDILELLATMSGGLTVSEIAQHLERSISEVFRVIVVMTKRGWLRRDPATDRYSVTYRVLDMAFRATPAQSLTYVAAPLMRELALATSQSCHLVAQGEERGMVIQRQENVGPVSFGMRMGATVDLITSCSGHVLLAFLTAKNRDALLGRLPRPDMLSLATLRQRLETVRTQGYEMQSSARTAGVTDISYPVFGFDGAIAAALTVPFLPAIDGSQITDIEETRHLLRDAARRVSLGLGWSGSQEEGEAA